MIPSLFRPLLRMIPLLLILATAGCGEIDWFPPYVKDPAAPNEFSFEAATGKEKGVDVTSGEIVVKGLTAATSPISISGAAGSKYSINGGAATSSAGTVKNDDKVTVTHKTATTLGTSTTSTLTIGGVSANFVSTTRTFDFVSPGFKLTDTQLSGFVMAYADFSTDTTAGPHLIAIKDSATPSTAEFVVTDKSFVTPPDLSALSGTARYESITGRRIFVRNLSSKASAITTLTIDGVDTVVPLTTP